MGSSSLNIARREFPTARSLFFYSNENDEPPHIHVETAGRTAKFWLAPVVLASSHQYSSGDLNRLRKIVDENVALFLDKWNEYFAR